MLDHNGISLKLSLQQMHQVSLQDIALLIFYLTQKMEMDFLMNTNKQKMTH